MILTRIMLAQVETVDGTLLSWGFVDVAKLVG